MSSWNVMGPDGVDATQGHSESSARHIAQERANKQGVAWSIYDSQDRESDAKEIEPAAYRAYDTTSEWSGPVRESVEAAERDAEQHNAGCTKQGGYGSALVVTRDPEAPGRLVDLEGESVWPPHGRSTGAARWAAP